MDESELQKQLVEALSRPGYGTTAEEILCVCKLVGRACQELDPDEQFEIIGTLKNSITTWKRMRAVSENKTLWKLRESLPANFSALYRLSLLSESDCEAGVREGSITPGLSSRAIERLKKRSEINSRYKTSKHQLFMFVIEELDEEALDALVADMNLVAQKHRVCFDTKKLEEIKKENNQKLYDIRSQMIRFRLQEELDSLKQLGVVSRGGGSEQIQGSDENDPYIDSTLQNLVVTLKAISEDRNAMMLKFGRFYCLKIAQEYWRTDSRSQRYNYKRRLSEVSEKYPFLAGHVQWVLDYCINVDKAEE